MYTIVFFILTSIFFSQCYAEKTVIRIGHFPNITHAQGMIAHQLARQGKGWFEQRLGKDVEIQWLVYEAGPSAMEGLFIGGVDLIYIGPSPTINAYVRSNGEEVRIIAGACSGGTALVVQSDSNIKTDQDFKGKKIGTPSFGNTQDVAARSWLRSIGLHVTLTGGDAYVIPGALPDQFILFKTKQLDAIWAVEPWVSKLVSEAKGKIYFKEEILWPETNGKYVTTHLVSSTKFLKDHSDDVKKIVAAHVELTEWIKTNPYEAKNLFNQEMKAETNFFLPYGILNKAWENIELTYDPIKKSLFRFAQEAKEIGFLKGDISLEKIYDLQFLEESKK